MRQPSPVLTNKMSSEVDDTSLREMTRSSYKLPHDVDFQCPRCGRRMEEPRLLPCLHPICLSCVYELMNRRKWLQIAVYFSRWKRRTFCPAINDNQLSQLQQDSIALENVKANLIDRERRIRMNRILCVCSFVRSFGQRYTRLQSNIRDDNQRNVSVVRLVFARRKLLDTAAALSFATSFSYGHCTAQTGQQNTLRYLRCRGSGKMMQYIDTCSSCKSFYHAISRFY